MTTEEKHHLNFEIYQRNRRYMCWGAMSMMLICTAATVYDPARMEADQAGAMNGFLACCRSR